MDDKEIHVEIITPKGTKAAKEETVKQYEPELGQAVFGTAWAEYECPSIVGELLYELSKGLAQLSPEAQVYGFLGGDYGYAQDFQNEIFEMHPYYWGECTCGHDAEEAQWHEANKHKQDCYQELVKLELMKHGWTRNEWDGVDPPKDLEYDERNRIKNEIRKEHCEKFGLSFPGGRAIHCTCGYQERWIRFATENDHNPECPTMVPNFRHFETNTEIRWYKYIGRGMSVNKELAGTEWIKIIQKCIDSLKAYQVPVVITELRTFFGDRHFQSSQDGERWQISAGLSFPKGVSDRIRDEDEAMAECAIHMRHWIASLNLALATHKAEWLSPKKPYWPCYAFPPSCGPEGPSKEYKEKFPDEATYEKEAMKYFEWDDDPNLLSFTDEHWKPVRWAGINTELKITPVEAQR